MMTKYRPHRGSLAQAIAEEQEAHTFADLRRILATEPAPFGSDLVSVTPYRYDARIGWETHIVMAKFRHDGTVFPAGFTDGMPDT